MDAVVGFIIWPFVTLFSYARFTLAGIFSSPFLLSALISGKNPLSDFSGMFNGLLLVPLGKYFFSGLVGVYAPYQSSVLPVVQQLKNGTCIATMEDWPWLRNPFSSVHAAALTNLGEAVGGIALMAEFQKYKHLRGIPVRLTTVFIAKARGTITGTAHVKLDDVSGECEKDFVASLHDNKGMCVAEVTVTWKLSLKNQSNENKTAVKEKNK